MKDLSVQTWALWAKKSNDGRLLWLPLVTHLADSAAVAKRLWNCWLPDGVKLAITGGDDAGVEPMRKLFVFLMAAHDIGKATPLFQAKDSYQGCSDLDERITEMLINVGLPMKPYRDFTAKSQSPHALATQLLLEQAGCGKGVAAIVGAHHGKPSSADMLNQQGICSYGENYHMEKEGATAWTAVQRELIAYALALSGFSALGDLPRPSMAAQVLLSGLTVMADWIASNERYFPYIRLEDATDALDAQERAERAWKSLDLPSSWPPGNDWKNTNLYQARFGFDTPRPMQQAVVEVAASIQTPGILVLEAPMGMGKTEAALAAAEIFAYKAKRSGVFFALPSQATSNAIFKRLLDWTEHLETDAAHSINLAHGKAQFNEEFHELSEESNNIGVDEEHAAIVHQWFKGSKTALLADFVVGTIDQLLMAALKQKHVMLRHLGLAGKVVIIDECHAYDAYMNQYLERALRWFGAYRVPVIVLSATLPADRRRRVIDAYRGEHTAAKSRKDPLGRRAAAPVIIPEWTVCRAYPLISYTDGDEVLTRQIEQNQSEKTIHIISAGQDIPMDVLAELLADGGCAGVIVNTVKRAQETAYLLEQRFGENTVTLLHSAFLAPDRAQKERQLLEMLGKPANNPRRPKRHIVVGTQVIEQSLDIDFDVLFSDICPMDLLIQRIGRLHRHERCRPQSLQTPVCHVMGAGEDEIFPDGAVAVYGEYWLLRTRALLPSHVAIPSDIPDLVQNVYKEDYLLPFEPESYAGAKEKQRLVTEQKKSRASQFRVSAPDGADIVGWLNAEAASSDKGGEAAVRDCAESIEVLVVARMDNDRMRILQPQADDEGLSACEPPPRAIARVLARQSLRLPHVLCAAWNIDQTIAELEQRNQELLAWQESPWLKGELFLIFDADSSVNLNGYHLTYNQQSGLRYEKERDANGGQGI